MSWWSRICYKNLLTCAWHLVKTKIMLSVIFSFASMSTFRDKFFNSRLLIFFRFPTCAETCADCASFLSSMTCSPNWILSSINSIVGWMNSMFLWEFQLLVNRIPFRSFFKFWPSDLGLAISLSRLCRWTLKYRLSVLNFWDLGNQLSFSISQTSNTSKTICTFLRQLWTVYFPTRWKRAKDSFASSARAYKNIFYLDTLRTYKLWYLQYSSFEEFKLLIKYNPESVQILLLRRQLRRCCQVYHNDRVGKWSAWPLLLSRLEEVFPLANRWLAAAFCSWRSWWWNAAEPYDNNVRGLPLPFFFPPSRTVGKS